LSVFVLLADLHNIEKLRYAIGMSGHLLIFLGVLPIHKR